MQVVHHFGSLRLQRAGFDVQIFGRITCAPLVYSGSALAPAVTSEGSAEARRERLTHRHED